MRVRRFFCVLDWRHVGGLCAAVLALLLCALPRGALAEDAARAEVRAYVWGNSLIHHLTETDETTVPHWLAHLAEADGQVLRLDGQFGFTRDYAKSLPPEPNWAFAEVTPGWRADQTSFAEAGIDTVMLNPENFIQYQAPDAAYEGDNPQGYSALSATAEVFQWVRDQGIAPRFFLYEGWAELGVFPPNRWQYRRYLRRAQGDYHSWYREYVDGVRAALPGSDVRLIPVGSVLMQLLRDGPLDDLPAQDLFTDDAPHGTATTYFLAALITYASLYEAPPPQQIANWGSIDPRVQVRMGEITAFIWDAVQPDLPSQREARGPVAPADAVRQVARTAPPEASTGAARREAQGLSNPSLAMGLSGVADYATQYPFLDLMKSARPWVGHLPDAWGAVGTADLRAGGYLDAQGWPRALPPDVTHLETFVLTEQPPEARSLDARYRVTWEGTATLTLSGLAEPLTERAGDKEIWFRHSPQGDGLVALALRDIDPQDPIRNITILREDHIALHEAGALFNPDFVNRINDLRVLRFMDWMQTNGSNKVTWADRAKPEDYSFSETGVPVEYIIALCNLIGADAWVTLPHQADDAFLRRYAERMRDGLDPGLRVYAEYSNELWNTIFPQAAYARAQAKARWGDAAGADAWMQWAGLRAAQMAEIWTEVFAEQPDRLVPVISVHTAWPGLEAPLLDAPLWVAEGQNPPAVWFKAYAVTGYFGGDLGGPDHAPRWITRLAEVDLEDPADRRALFSEMAAHIRQTSLPDLIENLWPYHAEQAAARGMRLIMYEGGTHVAPHGTWTRHEGLSALFQAFNYAPEMTELYEVLLAGWHAAGGTLFNAFVDIAPPSQFGSWGALRHIDDRTERWDLLMAANATPPAWAEPRPAGAFHQGITTIGGPGADLLDGTPARDILIGGPGDDSLVSRGGADLLHGGAGVDVAVLPGPRAAYTVSRAAGQVLAQRGSVTLRLTEVERLQFDDVSLDMAAFPDG